MSGKIWQIGNCDLIWISTLTHLREKIAISGGSSWRPQRVKDVCCLYLRNIVSQLARLDKNEESFGLAQNLVGATLRVYQNFEFSQNYHLIRSNQPRVINLRSGEILRKDIMLGKRGQACNCDRNWVAAISRIFCKLVRGLV